MVVPHIRNLQRRLADVHSFTADSDNTLTNPAVSTMMSFNSSSRLNFDRPASYKKMVVEPESMRPMFLSVWGKDHAAIARMVESKSCDLNTPIKVIDKSPMMASTNPNHTTILCVAVENSSVLVVQTLLEGGANIDCVNEFNQPLLSIAVLRGDCALVELLLKAGSADFMHLRDEFGETCLHHAVSKGVSIVKAIVRLPGGAALVNAVACGGLTPIMVAAGGACEVTISVLIDAGANLRAVSNTGASCCGLACASRNHRACSTHCSRLARRSNLPTSLPGIKLEEIRTQISWH
jgi:ankyrin repeat protein